MSPPPPPPSPPLEPGTVTLLGFGGRAPPVVLDLAVAAASPATTASPASTSSIRLQRSPGMERALAAPPYRTFVKNKNNHQTGSRSNSNTNRALLIYQLPASWIECVSRHGCAEAARVRALIWQHQSAVVVAYSPHRDCLVTGGGGGAAVVRNEDIVTALLQSENDDSSDGHSNSMALRAALARAALAELAALEAEAADRALNPNEGGDTVIVVGGGGREHALAVQLARSPAVGSVVCCPGNGGTATEGGGKIRNEEGADPSSATVIALAQKLRAAMVVVGPEAPLVDGLVDRLAEECPGVLAFGPTRAAAQLEASKAFSKDFLRAHRIPTAAYRNFTSADEAVAHVRSLRIDATGRRQVVKASGLAAGKGVLLPTTEAETVAAVREIMSDKAFGAAGDTCVIESFLTGPEASCLAFCDGKTAKLMPAAQDHKRAFDGDRGPNTGGMGAYAPAPCVTPDLQAQILSMCQTTVERMAARGTPYVGVLYAGMMLTPTDGPCVLEFNCRFGDPEAQVVLPLLETDLYEILTACCTGTLDRIDVRFREGAAAAAVVCAARGYPQSYPRGMRVTGLAEASAVANAKVYHAGTQLDGAAVPRCAGGRVLAVTGTGDSLPAALRAAYRGVAQLDFVQDDGDAERKSLLHRRTDIGRKAVERKLRIGVLGSTRGTALIPVIEACQNGTVHAEIVAVLSNKEAAPILEKGRALGPTVLTRAVSSRGLTRAQFDAECTAALLGAGVEYVLLVGYMRILSAEFCEYWRGRCVNVHPSLLPRHAGGMDLAVHRAVLAANETESGCTVHQVTEDVDGGPIVVQKRVAVAPDDTAESLKAKVQPLEGPAFVEAIQQYCRVHTNTGVMSYADAGVSIDAGNRLVDRIKPLCRATRRSGCDADLGGFGGLFDLAAAGYDAAETVLIGATDGVGTKLKIAHVTGRHDTVGVDLVAMCVNDLVVAGGEPLFFLDYFATGHLEVEQAADVVKGIAEGCKQSGCGLIGGETAEMPSMYAPGDYDLAGFTVGAVHRDRILPRNVSVGNVLLGISSSGIHSNGFSLVRKLIEKEGLSYDSPCPWDPSKGTVGNALLVPTKIYVKSCLPLIKEGLLNGLAHITGGGLLENLPRSLPKGVAAEISNHPPLPPVFKWMQKASGLDDSELLRTFNCGIGMVLILPTDKAQAAKEMLKAAGETDVWEIGKLVEGDQDVQMKVSLV